MSKSGDSELGDSLKKKTVQQHTFVFFSSSFQTVGRSPAIYRIDLYPVFCFQRVSVRFQSNDSNTVTEGWMELLVDWIRNKKKRAKQKGKRTSDSVGSSSVIKFTLF
jgi:hypothetical protein